MILGSGLLREESRQEAGARRQEAGARRQEPGVGSQEAGGRRQEATGEIVFVRVLRYPGESLVGKHSRKVLELFGRGGLLILILWDSRELNILLTHTGARWKLTALMAGEFQQQTMCETHTCSLGRCSAATEMLAVCDSFIPICSRVRGNGVKSK